jgi:hypothetical protein
MNMKTITAPVTLLHNGQYVPPGTKVSLPADEADSIVERFGSFDGPVVLTTADIDSINALNENHARFSKK